MAASNDTRKAWSLIGLASALAVLAYWAGLSGPFLLDDAANLSSIPEWLHGKLGLYSLIFERGAGMFGRPVSMASFALNAWVGGYTPYALKLGNLVVHVLCGLAIFAFLRVLLRRDPLLQKRPSMYAAIAAAVWLLHPLHASTVLYVVQRMAQLSTLLILLGLWLYVVVRERLQRDPTPLAGMSLLLGVPAVAAAAFLAKENGILLLPLCLVVEFAYFRNVPRPKLVRFFHIAYVAVPVLGAVLGFIVKPARILDGYAGRDFTLFERLLSQPRVLCDYLVKLLVPKTPRMGVYTDDFVVSTSLLSPSTTLAAIVLLLTISLAAWYWRRRLPALLFGWGFFLVGHALEAGPIPLELYFEHRNYLPSLGIFVTVVGLVVAFGDVLAKMRIRPGRIGAVLLIGVLAVLTFGTHGRALIWQSPSLIAESALLAHPQSLRANVAVMTSALQRGDRTRANEAIGRIIASESSRTRALGHAYRLLVECELDQRSRPEDLWFFVKQAKLPITIAEAQPFHHLYQISAKAPCPPLTDKAFGTAAALLVDRSVGSALRQDNWRIRYQAAAFMLRAGDAEGAREQAQRAWNLGADPPVASTLILAQLKIGDIPAAQQILKELEERADPSNVTEQANIRRLRVHIAASQAAIKRTSKTR